MALGQHIKAFVLLSYSFVVAFLSFLFTKPCVCSHEQQISQVVIWRSIRCAPDVFCSSTGLSAAKLLKANGLNPVVLEARNRVGGRTYTVRVRLGPLCYNCSVR